jgi:FlaA1/EpsC-like NDP-sugar epimerase
VKVTVKFHSNLFKIVRRWFIFLCNLSMIASSLLASFLLRFDFAIPPGEIQTLRVALPIALVSKTAVFVAARLHQGWCKLVCVHDLARVFLANGVASLAFWAVVSSWVGPRFARSV